MVYIENLLYASNQPLQYTMWYILLLLPPFFMIGVIQKNLSNLPEPPALNAKAVIQTQVYLDISLQKKCSSPL